MILIKHLEMNLILALHNSEGVDMPLNKLTKPSKCECFKVMPPICFHGSYSHSKYNNIIEYRIFSAIKHYFSSHYYS